MKVKDLKKFKLPDGPGVYYFLKDKEILYIGKATSLRDRVKSYFNKDLMLSRGPRITTMIDECNVVRFRPMESVLEALMFESAEIKRYQPFYNVREKDDKSYWQVVMTKEDFPQVLQVRSKDLEPEKYLAIFGPFPNGAELKEALKIIRRILPYRDNKCTPNQGKLYPERSRRACFNRQIGLCPGVCTGEISKADYKKIITNLKLFFKGEKRAVVKNLEIEMKRLSKRQEFERAGRVRNQIFALNHIRDVSLIKNPVKEQLLANYHRPFRIEAYDVAHTSGKEVVGVMTVVEDGEANKQEYRKFKLKREQNNDIAGLAEIISRRLSHPEWRYPNVVVVDGGAAHLKAAQSVLSGSHSWPVVAVTKDERHRAKQILGDPNLIKSHEAAILLANSEAHRFAITYHRKRRGKLV